jgi:hypothetical protein
MLHMRIMSATASIRMNVRCRVLDVARVRLVAVR